MPRVVKIRSRLYRSTYCSRPRLFRIDVTILKCVSLERVERRKNHRRSTPFRHESRTVLRSRRELDIGRARANREKLMECSTRLSGTIVAISLGVYPDGFPCTAPSRPNVGENTCHNGTNASAIENDR